MNTNKKKIRGRIALLAVVFLLLLTTLTGCFGGRNASTKTLTVNTGVFTAQTEKTTGLPMDQLRSIANMLASTCTADFDTQEMLVAANRGYDMTVEGFDEAVERPDLGTNVEFAKNVINKANEKAKDDQKLLFSIDALTAEDVGILVNSLKSEISLASEGNFLTKAINTLLTWIGAVLNWITKYLGFGSYLVGICIFAILIEICMLPFDIKQQKNSIRQAKLRPKEMAIRNKYKGRTDQPTMQKMQQEIQEFYQRENYSPYSGCLPLLVQLPIIMALYNIIMDPLHYVLGQAQGVSAALSTYYTAAKAAGGMGGVLASSGSSNTIALLSQIKEQGVGIFEGLKDFQFYTNGVDAFNSVSSIADSIPNFKIGSINLGLNPNFSGQYILLLVPVLTFVAYFVTSKINRKFMAQPMSSGAAEDKQVACSNNMMDITMPLMSTWFTFMVPALIGIYWVFRSLIGLLKRFIMSKVMPLPVFTEEDYKEAAKEMAGKRVVEKSERVGKVRSLHHIDDEDFADTRERALARKAALEEEEQKEQAEKQKKTPFEAPFLKKSRAEEKQESDQTDAEQTSEPTDKTANETEPEQTNPKNKKKKK